MQRITAALKWEMHAIDKGMMYVVAGEPEGSSGI